MRPMQEEMRHRRQCHFWSGRISVAVYSRIPRGWSHEFGPERIVDTPIAESGMFGVAFGAAQEGLSSDRGFHVRWFFLRHLFRVHR